MRIRLATSLLLLCFAVPATAAKRGLPETPFAATQPTEIILTQQELAVEVPDSSAATAQYGLLGALIGSAITNAQVKNGEQRVGQLRNLLLDYPFNARMEAALRDKLADAGIVGKQGVKVLHTTWDAEDPTAAASVGETIMLAPRYAILNNFELLSVKLSFNHVERIATPGRKPRQKILYGRSYSYNFPLSKVPGSGADEDAVRWVGFGREPLETLLDHGIDQVTDMLVYDLSSEARSEALLPIRGQKGHVGDTSFAGRVVREGDGWIWVRAGAGVMRTLVGQHPVSESVIAALPPRAEAAGSQPTGAPATGDDAVDSEHAVDAVHAPAAAEPEVNPIPAME